MQHDVQASRFEMRRAPVAARAGLLALCVLQVALLSACAKTTAAELVPDGPPLAMSVPPPRVITPVEEVAVSEPLPPPAPEPAAAPPPRPAARPPARTEVKPDPPPPAATQPVPPASTAAEPLEVRSVPSAAAASEERKVRDVMTRASRDLLRVDYQRLSVEGKSNYDQSKRFSDQAEQALKDRNFVLAMTVAEKAAILAAELAGR